MAVRLPPAARAAVRVGPHGGAHWVALRAAVCVLVPLLVLLSTGHTDECVYAAFGAFTSVYGRYRTYADRARMQVVAGALLVTAVVTGTATAVLPDPRWTVVVGAAVWAGLGGVLSDAWDWHPPGALFLVFGYAVCAQVPAGAGDLPVALGVSGAAALFALAVGASGALLPWSAPRTATRARPGVVGAWRRPGGHAHLVRLVGGAGLAGCAANLSGLGHPYWATVAAVVPMAAPDTAGRIVKALQRVAGTAVGLLVAAGLLGLDLSAVRIVLLIAVLQLCAELVIGRNYALAMLVVTPLALLLGQLARPLPTATLVRDRALETLIGAATAVLLTLLTHDRERPG